MPKCMAEKAPLLGAAISWCGDKANAWTSEECREDTGVLLTELSLNSVTMMTKSGCVFEL